MRTSTLLEQCLRTAAANPANRPLILAVDALDEAEWRLLPSRVNVHYLPPVLPDGVYVVVTTRTDRDIPLELVQRRDLDIEPASEGNLLDLRAYLEQYASRSGIRARLNEWQIDAATFVKDFLHKSQGNFIYLRYVLPTIEAGLLEAAVFVLPHRIQHSAIVNRFWRRREGSLMPGPSTPNSA